MNLILFDVSGQQVRQYKNERVIDVSDLSSGFYFLEGNIGKEQKRAKLIKN